MKYFTLGKQFLSKYCLGTWSLGGDKNKNISYGNIDNINAEKLLNYAFQKGINFFDTANVYGLAEKRIGHTFKRKRNQVFIANKVGCTSYDKKLNFSKTNIKKQIYQSLKNLNSEYIDLVQLYSPNPKDKNLKECINFLHKQKEMGIVRYIGLSLRNPSDYIELRKLYKFNSVQCNFNVLDQRLLNTKIFQLLKKDKVKIFARTILNFGIFTNKFINKKKFNFKKNDHRYKWDTRQINIWRDHIKKLKYFASRPIENTCYRYCNSFNISSLIIGATLKKHIDVAIDPKNYIKLNRKEIGQINKIYNIYNKNLILKPKFKMKSF